MARKPRTFDTQGRIVRDAAPKKFLRGLGDTSDNYSDTSIGASIWQLLHPFQVQDEYTAVGATPPPVSQIISDSAANIETGTVAGVESALTTGSWVLIGVAVLAGLYFLAEISAVKRHV